MPRCSTRPPMNFPTLIPSSETLQSGHVRDFVTPAAGEAFGGNQVDHAAVVEIEARPSLLMVHEPSGYEAIIMGALHDLEVNIDTLGVKIDTLGVKISNWGDNWRARIDNMGVHHINRLDTLETRIDNLGVNINNCMDRLESRIDKLRVKTINNRIVNLNQKLATRRALLAELGKRTALLNNRTGQSRCHFRQSRCSHQRSGTSRRRFGQSCYCFRPSEQLVATTRCEFEHPSSTSGRPAACRFVSQVHDGGCLLQSRGAGTKPPQQIGL